MIIDKEKYERMRDLVLAVIQEGRKIKSSDCYHQDFDVEALISLHSQVLLRQRKAEFKNNDSENLARALLSKLKDYHKDKTSLRAISDELGIGSYRTAKIAIELLVRKLTSINQFVEDPLLIEDPSIRQDILDCIMNDPLCSLECDQQKECSGKEFESLLLQQLQSRNMCFETEADLRNRGKPKTPDILLIIPMGVNDFQNNDSKSTKQQPQQLRSYVINWIDSKGMFADEETFEENYEQLKSYVNRYGAGMVIYWHGFVHSLTRLNDEMIFISDRFPDNWVFPSGEPADGRIPEFDRHVSIADDH